MPAATIALISFLFVHYGMLTAVHGVFVFALFGRASEISGFPTAANVTDVVVQCHPQVAVLALVRSHGYSFVQNSVAVQEYRSVTLRQLMAQPYSRMVVLH
jgi:hypothetical protein